MKPASLEDAVSLMGDDVGFPGGASLEDVQCLHWISISGNQLVVGSLVPWGRLRDSALVKDVSPRLWDASLSFDANWAVGESLIKCPPDGPTEIPIALGARIELISSASHREIDLSSPPQIAPGELLVSVRFPLP